MTRSVMILPDTFEVGIYNKAKIPSVNLQQGIFAFVPSIYSDMVKGISLCIYPLVIRSI